MTRDEYDSLVQRLIEINREFARLEPEIMKAGGSKDKARVDSAWWAQRLGPLFDEHHEIVQKLQSAAVVD